ncbi:MAG: hypothetical protein E4H21_04445 [Thermodesulfobacteriales bacterium]|nr:MAG: hypothetical protein E4H21_04445 [Thermodesulfobacteriales bacterium]
MRRSLFLFSILLFLGVFAVHFTVYMAYADDSQIHPNPEPLEATTVKSSKSNSSERQIHPNPEPTEATSVKSSEDSGGDLKRGTASQKPGKCGIIRVGKGDRSSGAKGDSSTCGGLCEGLDEICIQDMLNGPCYYRPGI